MKLGPKPMDAITFFTAEALACHKLFDELGAPRVVDGEPQSLSERALHVRDGVIKLRNLALAQLAVSGQG